QFRAERQRARDRHHLAFAAGERVAAARAVALELGEHAVNPLDPRLGLPRLRMRPGWQRDIFRDRELAEYFALLRRKADPTPRDPVWAQPDEIRTLETDDRAGCRFAKTHDGAQARGLARAVAADQIDQLARLDLEGDATQHAAALDVHGQIFDPQHRCPIRLPMTLSIRRGSAKNCVGGRSASTRPSASAMIRCE